MMKIYIPLFEQDSHNFENPFVSSFTDAMLASYDDVSFKFGLDFLGDKECEDYDIIHFMWPHFFGEKMLAGFDLEKRIVELRKKNVKIVATCHNFHSHIQYDKYSDETYDIVYRQSDAIIHLGDYSRIEFCIKYPFATNVLIPHHVYDTIYSGPSPREESLQKLSLSSEYNYVLTLGAFRTEEEKQLVKRLGKALKQDKIRILAPSIMKFPPKNHKNPKKWYRALKEYCELYHSGIITKAGFVSNEELSYYFGVSSVTLIQRPKILNSGNVPMGLYMGNVVVGPNVGNVGPILNDRNNPTFDPNSEHSVLEAVREGFNLYKDGMGTENRRYCISHLSTAMAAQRHYDLYKTLCTQ